MHAHHNAPPGSVDQGARQPAVQEVADWRDWRSGAYALVAVNVLMFMAANVLQALPINSLQLSAGRSFGWWQLLSSGFLHLNAHHLAETCFLGYTFGRMLERSHGAWGMWATYMASVLGESGMTWTRMF